MFKVILTTVVALGIGSFAFAQDATEPAQATPAEVQKEAPAPAHTKKHMTKKSMKHVAKKAAHHKAMKKETTENQNSEGMGAD